MGDPIANLAQRVVDALYSFGYVGVGVLTALGYLHLLPLTQLVLPLAGFLVGQGLFSFQMVLFASTVGGVASSLVMYLPGLWIGEKDCAGSSAGSWPSRTSTRRARRSSDTVGRPS